MPRLVSPTLGILTLEKKQQEGHHQFNVFHFTYNTILNICCFIPLRKEPGTRVNVEAEGEPCESEEASA